MKDEKGENESGQREKIQIRRYSNHRQAVIKSEGIKMDRPPGNSRRIDI